MIYIQVRITMIKTIKSKKEGNIKLFDIISILILRWHLFPIKEEEAGRGRREKIHL